MSDFEDWAQSLKDKDESIAADYWEPEKVGDMIVGYVHAKGRGETDYGEYDYLTLNVVEGRREGGIPDPSGNMVQLSMFGAVRKHWFERNESFIKPGSIIVCTFKGEAKGKTGHTYKDFELFLINEYVNDYGPADGLPF